MNGVSVIFASMHLFVSTSQQTSLPLFVLALVGPGLVLGWAYLRSGSLWLPIGLHFGWNLAKGDLFNLVGGQNLDSIFGAQTQLQGPSWLVGTAFGIETGALSLVSLGITLGGVWLWTRKRIIAYSHQLRR